MGNVKNESMEPPLIQKKQIVALLLAIATVPFVSNSGAQYFLLAFIVVLFFNAFAPFLFYKLKYSRYIHAAVYYLPMYIPIVVMPELIAKLFSIPSLFSLFLAAALGMALLWIKRRFANPSTFQAKLKKKDVPYEVLIAVITLIGEEVFFRGVLISMLGDLGILEVSLFSACCFVLIHFLNRWADRMFDRKSYLFHFIVGFIAALLFILSESLIPAIVFHAIFNADSYYEIYLRTQVVEDYSFDDY